MDLTTVAFDTASATAVGVLVLVAVAALWGVKKAISFGNKGQSLILPELFLTDMGIFFTAMLIGLASVWGINKAIIISKLSQRVQRLKGLTMKKLIFSLLLFSNFLNASMLLDKSYPLCIEDYYIQGGSLYYLSSSSNSWSSTTADKSVKEIHPGYIFDSNGSKCIPNDSTILGISLLDWNFLTALTGLLFGFIVFTSSIYVFINVGGKR